MKRYLILFAVLLGCVVMSSSCTKEKDPGLVGKWGCYQILWTPNSRIDECDPADPKTQLVFEENGKMYSPLNADNKSPWYTKGNMLFMDYVSTEYTISDANHMTIKYPDESLYAHVEYYVRVK